MKKSSINIENYLNNHPNWNVVFELDPENEGYGWLVHRTPKPITLDSPIIEAAIESVNPTAKRENLRLYTKKER